MTEKHPLSQFKYCPICGSNAFEVANFKAKKCGSCDFEYYFNITAAVAVIIRNEKGEILVATRANEPARGTLDLPGGFVDMHETAEEAAMREIKEETGLTVTNCRYLFSIPNTYLYSGFEVQTMDLFFECTVKAGEKPHAEDDVETLTFKSLSELRPEDFGLTSIRQAMTRLKQLQP